jgi:hypothetical protein
MPATVVLLTLVTGICQDYDEVVHWKIYLELPLCQVVYVESYQKEYSLM